MKSGNRFPVFLIRTTLGLLFIVAGIHKVNDMDSWLYGQEVRAEAAAPKSGDVVAPEKSDKAADVAKAGEAPEPEKKRAGGLFDQFKGKLPHFSLVIFGYVLPFVELLGGIWLMTGFFGRWSLRLMGLTLVALTFGPMLIGKFDLVANNAFWVLLAAIALKWSSEPGENQK